MKLKIKGMIRAQVAKQLCEDGIHNWVQVAATATGTDGQGVQVDTAIRCTECGAIRCRVMQSEEVKP